MGVACGFLAEGSKILEWLKHESGVDKSICREPHERFKWKRQTINSARSFEMYYPHIGVSGNVHVEDIAEFFLKSNPLGIRSRMLFFYTCPRFLQLAEIHDANVELNTDVLLSCSRS